MATIEVDFDVYKELTIRRTSETMTYNDVIRNLVGLDRASPSSKKRFGYDGANFKGVQFPEGTLFRATYKGRTYTAEIKNGTWIDSDGLPRNSPSEAAIKITGKPWNGWRFWFCQRPSDLDWILIDKLRPQHATGDNLRD